MLAQWYAFLTGTLLYSAISLFAREKRSVRIDLLTIAVSGFAGYLLAHSMLSEHASEFRLTLLCLILSYWLFKTENPDIDAVIVSSCALEGLYGIGQWAGLVPSDSVFRMTGSFDNPAGLAACLTAGLPFCLYLGKKSACRKSLGRVASAIAGLSVVLSGSRTGMFAAGVVVSLYAYGKYRLRLKLRQRRIVMLSVLGIFLASSTTLFFIKKDSAADRLLIWDVSARLIPDAPVLGTGHGTCLSRYMPCQAAYFENGGKWAGYDYLADNVNHPFSEYLNASIEYGAVGLILLLVPLLILSLKIPETPNPYLLSVAGIAVFALFSYPTRYAFVCLTAVCSLSRCSGIYSSPVKWNIRVRTAGRILAILLTGIGFYHPGKDIAFEYRWKKATEQRPPDARKYHRLYEFGTETPIFFTTTARFCPNWDGIRNAPVSSACARIT